MARNQRRQEGQTRRAISVEAAIINNPCFAYDPKTKKPVLARGETVAAEGARKGVSIFVTSAGRKIYACTIAEFVEKFGPLPQQTVACLALQAPSHALAGLVLPRSVVEDAKGAVLEALRMAREAGEELRNMVGRSASADKVAARAAELGSPDEGESDEPKTVDEDLVDVADVLGAAPAGDPVAPPAAE